MAEASLSELYRAYIACLNRQDWDALGRHVADDVRHNGRAFGLAGYRDMLVRDFKEIPDLRFEIDVLVCEAPRVFARLLFDCRPKGRFMGLAVDGRRVAFAEHVAYEYRQAKIAAVWSVIDKAAIEAQLGA